MRGRRCRVGASLLPRDLRHVRDLASRLSARARSRFQAKRRRARRVRRAGPKSPTAPATASASAEPVSEYGKPRGGPPSCRKRDERPYSRFQSHRPRDGASAPLPLAVRRYRARRDCSPRRGATMPRCAPRRRDPRLGGTRGSRRARRRRCRRGFPPFARARDRKSCPARRPPEIRRSRSCIPRA